MYLSKGGKLTLIKSLLSSFPTFYLSLFVFPPFVADLIEKMRRKFLWAKWKGPDGQHLVAWKEVCQPLNLKRVDIRIIRTLLSKWLWRFGLEKNSFWRRVIAGKYGMINKWETKKVSSSHGVSLGKGISRKMEWFK